MSALVKSILRVLIVLDPIKRISADLNKGKEVLALIHDIEVLHGSHVGWQEQ